MNDQKNVINLKSSQIGATIKMAEGNPGALIVLMQILKKETGIIIMCHLDDLQIRGWKIWYAYKDYCNQDLNKFIELVTNRDKEMVNFINDFGKH